MNDDHPIVGIEQLNVVGDFCFAAVQIQDRPPDEMFADKYPAFLINEWRIGLSSFSRRNEDGVVVDFENFIPGNEFIRPAHAVFNIKTYCNGKRFHELKYQVGESPDFLVEFSATNPPLKQTREIKQLVIFLGKRGRSSIRCWKWSRRVHNKSALLGGTKQFREQDGNSVGG